MVDQPVDHGGSDDVVTEHVAPAAEGFVGGDDQAGAFACARSATADSATPATSGRCPCSSTDPEPAPTTTDAASAETPTGPQPRTSPTASLGSCTTASKCASATTKPRPSYPTSRSPLDNLRACDVSVGATTNLARTLIDGIGSRRSSQNSSAPSDHGSTADNFACFRLRNRPRPPR